MTVKLPQNNNWNQQNKGDIFGSLRGSFNIDLTTNFGEARINRTLTTTSGLDGLPVAFKSTGALIYALAGTKVYVSSALKTNTSFSADVAASTPTDCDSGSDMEVFLSGIAVAANSKLYYYTSSWVNNSLGFTGPYSMCVFANILYIAGVGGVIKKTTDGTTITSGITLSVVDQEISWIRSGANRIWIGMTNIRNGKGSVLEWDGASAQTTRSYRLDAQGTLGCVIKDDIPWIVDTNGKLLVFSGGTFVEVDRLPLENKVLQGSYTTVTLGNKPIHKNGMSLINGNINILVRNLLDDSTTSTDEFCPSGVWEYTKETGLYHKYSLSYTAVGGNTITDYGQNRLYLPGALSEFKIGDTSATATGNFIAGATIYTNASSTSARTFTNDTFDAVSGTTGQYATQGFGYLVTPKIYATQLEDTWEKLYVNHSKFLTATDRIIVKYRTSAEPPTEFSFTWLNSTALTTATDLSDYEVGDEVEVTQGTGSGFCAHITAIQQGSSVWILTLDETFTGVTTGTGKARIQKWKKAGQIQDDGTFGSVLLGTKGAWVQLKVCFLSTGKNEINYLALVNNPMRGFN